MPSPATSGSIATERKPTRSGTTRGAFHHPIPLFESDQIHPAQHGGSILQSLVRGILTVLMQIWYSPMAIS
jgi:hypothetical protein